MLIQDERKKNSRKKRKKTRRYLLFFSSFEKEGKRENVREKRKSVITTFRNNMTHNN